MLIKNKARLAFEMLEKEIEKLDTNSLKSIKGGTFYKYVTNPMTGQVERYHTNSIIGGATWYKDYDYNGGQDMDWSGPPAYSSYNGGSSPTSTGTNSINDPNNLYSKYETFLNTKYNESKNMYGASANKTKFYQDLMFQLQGVKESSYSFTLRYSTEGESKDYGYTDSLTAQNSFYSRVPKPIDINNLDNSTYELIAHEVYHQFQIAMRANFQGKDAEIEAYRYSLRITTFGLADEYYINQANNIMSHNPDLYGQSGYSSDSDLTFNLVSTGIDNIGYFQERSQYDSSGNFFIERIHPYLGQEGQYGEPNANLYWNNKTGLLSSGYDDIGLYYNYSYVDLDGNATTGSYHLMPSTGYGSSGIISTGMDENGTYWENYYVYEENGMYGPGTNEGPLSNPNTTYSTGYHYSTGTGEGSTGS